MKDSIIRYVVNVLIGIDILASAVTGGERYKTISSRCGESIVSGGWASKVRWPAWWRNHCLQSVHQAWV